MQHADDLDLAAALANPDVMISGRVEFDWNRDGLFDHDYSDLSWLLTSAKVDTATLTGDLPEQVNTVTGYSSAELTVVFGGTRHGDPDLDAAWDAELRAQGIAADQLFSPYWQDSPLYGVEVAGTPVRYSRVVETRAGERVVRQFTGWVRSYPINREDNTVTLTGSDVVDLQAGLVTLPHWCIQPPNAVEPGGGTGVMAGNIPGSLAWVVEETLRQAGRPTGPAARDDAVAYVSCNGTLLPSVGNIAWHHGAPFLVRHNIAYDPGVVQWRDGKYGLCFKALYAPYNGTRRNVVHLNASELVTVPQDGSGEPDRKIGISFWYEAHDDTSSGNQSYVSLCLDDWWLNGNTGIIAVFVSDSGALTAQVAESSLHTSQRVWQRTYSAGLSPAGWHYVNVIATITPTGVDFETHIDDTVVSPTTVTDPAGGFRYWLKPPVFRPNKMEIRPCAAPIQHAQAYHGDTTLTYTPGQQHPPTREGLPLALPYFTFTELQWVPDVHERNAWELLQEVVGAEFGVVHTNEHGQIIALSHPEMRQEALDAIAAVPPEIDDDRLLSFIVNPSLDNYCNTISIGATNRYAVFGHVYTNEGALDMYGAAGQNNSRVVGFNEVTTVDVKIAGVTATPPDDEPDITISSVSGVRADNVAIEHPTVPGAGGGISIDLRFPEPERPDARSGLVQWWVEAGEPAAYIGSYVGGNRASFHLAGLSYSDRIQQRKKVVNGDEVALRGTRAIEIEHSDWRQTLGSGEVTALNLLKDTTQPAPLVEPITIPADPRLQLRDVVKLTSEGGITGALYAQVINLQREDAPGGGSVDTVALRIVRTPGVALWDEPELGWGVGTWGE